MIREMIGDPSLTVNFTVISGERPGPEPIWPAVATGAAVLLAAAALAWWRRRAPVAVRPRRGIRILAAGAGGGGGALVQMASSGTMVTGAGGIGWDPMADSPLLVLFAHFLGYWLFAAMLVGTTDLLFDAFRPRRSRAWLVIGVPLFAAFIIAMLRATGWTDPLVIPPTRDQAIAVVASLAAGLIWWSWLPASWDPVAQVFE
jgi:hypothetical protein